MNFNTLHSNSAWVSKRPLGMEWDQTQFGTKFEWSVACYFTYGYPSSFQWIFSRGP